MPEIKQEFRESDYWKMIGDIFGEEIANSLSGDEMVIINDIWLQRKHEGIKGPAIGIVGTDLKTCFSLSTTRLNPQSEVQKMFSALLNMKTSPNEVKRMIRRHLGRWYDGR